MNVLKRQALSTPFHQYDDVCGWCLRGEIKERGEGDAGTSSTRNNYTWGRYSISPSSSLRTGFSFSFSSTAWATNPGTLPMMKRPFPREGGKPISSRIAAASPSMFRQIFFPFSFSKAVSMKVAKSISGKAVHYKHTGDRCKHLPDRSESQ